MFRASFLRRIQKSKWFEFVDMQNSLSYISGVTLPSGESPKRGHAVSIACPFSFRDIMSHFLER